MVNFMAIPFMLYYELYLLKIDIVAILNPCSVYEIPEVGCIVRILYNNISSSCTFRSDAYYDIVYVTLRTDGRSVPLAFNSDPTHMLSPEASRGEIASLLRKPRSDDHNEFNPVTNTL